MRQIIDLRRGLARWWALLVSISVVTGSAFSGCTGTDWVLTESKNHERCLWSELLVLPNLTPTGSNKIWTNDALC